MFPMSVDAAAFAALAADWDVRAEATAIRRSAAGRRIVVGVDRLDYTKGLPRRLIAIERLLTREPALRDSIRYVQVAVPSRGNVDAYKRFRREVEETVGRINGSCTTLRSAPVQYMHRSVSARELVALYCAADVMLVTPLRDGMNLVAKEFVASRIDDDGVLVLSELAGAASELGDAVLVNSYDADAVGAAVARALEMPESERRRRMVRLRAHVMTNDVGQWAETFVQRLCSTERPAPPAMCRNSDLARVIEPTSQASRLYILIDYDGTLVPIADAPEQALPDATALELLAEVSQSPGVDVHIVSGRPRQFLDRWFDRLPIALWAEHGFWRRSGAGAHVGAGRTGATRAARTGPSDSRAVHGQHPRGAHRVQNRVSDVALPSGRSRIRCASGARAADAARRCAQQPAAGSPRRQEGRRGSVSGNQQGAGGAAHRLRGGIDDSRHRRRSLRCGSLSCVAGERDHHRRRLRDPSAGYHVRGSDDVRALLRSIALTRRLTTAMS